MDERMFWYNYQTDEYDYVDAPTSDAEMVKYIPQKGAAQGLYRCHRELGKPIMEAALHVLSACVGEPLEEV